MTALLHEVAHLGHVELLTPEPERSLWFFTQVLGLTENGSSGDSVYLRTWDDYEHHSLKLTAAATSGIRRTGLRAASQDALQRRVARIEAAGLGVGWQDGDTGIGPTYLFRDPDGHELELYWETEWYRPPDELAPALKNQAQAYPARGVSVRRLDHVNYLAAQTEPNGAFICSALGARVTEQIRLNSGTISAQWMHFAQKSYDLVYTNDWTGANGAAAPHRVRDRHQGRHPQGRRHLHRPAGVHRDRPAQARNPADLLSLCVRARREPDRAVQPVCPAGLRAGLGDHHLDRGRAG